MIPLSELCAMVRPDGKPDLSVMKRYLLFAGHCYYARGGCHDFIGSFDTTEQATERAIAEEAKTSGGPSIDWWHVLDRDAMTIMASSEVQAFGGYKPPTMEVS